MASLAAYAITLGGTDYPAKYAALLANIARLYRVASLGLTGNAPGLAANQAAKALRLLMVDAYALSNAYADAESFDV